MELLPESHAPPFERYEEAAALLKQLAQVLAPAGASAVVALRRELEQTQPECGAALTQLRQAPPAAKEDGPGADVAARLGRLEVELEGARKQLREYQQSVELLRKECQGVGGQLQAVRELAAWRQQLEKEVEALRSQQVEPMLQLDQLRALCETVLADVAKLKSNLKKSNPADRKQEEPARPPAPRPPDRWYVVYQKEPGQMHEFQGTGAEVRRWYAETSATIGAAPRASRSPDGPFDLLTHFPEFGDLPKLAPKSEPAPKSKPAAAPAPDHDRKPKPPSALPPAGAAPSRRPSPLPSRPARVLPTPAPLGKAPDASKPTASGRFDWLYWFIPTALALISAAVIGQILFQGR